MIEYKFSKDGIKAFYDDTCTECFEALDNGTIDEMYIEVKMGNQFIKVPMYADCFEIIMAALKECDEVLTEDLTEILKED